MRRPTFISHVLVATAFYRIHTSYFSHPFCQMDWFFGVEFDGTCHLPYLKMDIDMPTDPFDLSNLVDLEQQQVCSL